MNIFTYFAQNAFLSNLKNFIQSLFLTNRAACFTMRSKIKLFITIYMFVLIQYNLAFWDNFYYIRICLNVRLFYFLKHSKAFRREKKLYPFTYSYNYLNVKSLKEHYLKVEKSTTKFAKIKCQHTICNSKIRL